MYPLRGFLLLRGCQERWTLSSRVVPSQIGDRAMALIRGFVPPFCAAAVLLCAACGSTMPFTIPEARLAPQAPAKAPDVQAVAPQLVAYPGLEVSYVANADGDVYCYRGVYYTFFDGSWFCAQALRGPWTFIEMKYVPTDLYRVRGHKPPQLR